LDATDDSSIPSRFSSLLTGVPVDPAQAYFWSTVAAKQNEKDAQKRLAALAGRLSREQASQVKQLANGWKPVLTSAK
jgi:hypothetical protein